MKLSKVLRTGTMWTAILGMALPTTAIGADPSGNRARTEIQDVALRPDGTLWGQLVNADGSPSAGTPIQFHRDGQMVAEAATDIDGRFVTRNLAGGVYAVQTPASVQQYRVWTHQAAPPSAARNLTVASDEIVRGQGGVCPPGVCPPGGGHGFGPKGHGMLSKPWLFGLGVAAAIAIPLAVDNNDRGPAS